MNTISGMFPKEGLIRIHEKALDVLQKIGLKIAYDGYYDGLEKAGANVNRSTGVVKFPPALVEQTIEDFRKMIADGKKQNILNGIMASKGEKKPHYKFAGACIEFLDPLTNIPRDPTEDDLIRLVKYGESIPEVGYVGNPVCYLHKKDGSRVEGALQRIQTAALVAKYTTKYGSNEVWNDIELDLLIELGSIVRGSEQAYFQKPCFVTAKETISPLLFPEEDGKVLYMLAKKGLPCTIIPMPISGVSCPVTVSSNIVMTAAEVLGVMTAIHCTFPEAMVAGGVISGVMDMKTASASFAAPEAILQETGTAKLFEELYGQDFGMGVGYIDALYPGIQSAIEIDAKMRMAFETGRYNYAVGLLLAGKRFSPVQAAICIEVGNYIHNSFKSIGFDDDDMPIDVLEDVGISGNFLGEDHTVERFKDAFWSPRLMERVLSQKPDIDLVMENAKTNWSEFVKKCDITEPAVSKEVAKAIDDWEVKAIKILSK